jgi:hypothetical protein
MSGLAASADREHHSPCWRHASRRGILCRARLPMRTVTSPEGGYLVEVRDRLARFTPFVMHVCRPKSRSSCVPRCASCADAVGVARNRRVSGCALQSAVTHGSRRVRRRSRQPDRHQTQRPRHSLSSRSARVGNVLGRGIADERGEAVVMFAYPEPESAPPWSPPAPPSRPRPPAEQQWTVSVSVRYRPPLQRYRLDPSLPALVDLCDVLEQPAPLWRRHRRRCRSTNRNFSTAKS